MKRSRMRWVAVVFITVPFLLAAERPFGCGGTPRLLEVDAPDGSYSPNLAVVGRTETYSQNVLSSMGPYSPFETVRWRGDPNSYVDVYDVPVLEPGIDGASFANVVRLPYPHSVSSSIVAEFDPGAIFASATLPLQVPPWRGARAIRMYDRGECSGAVSWRELADGFADAFDRILWEQGYPSEGPWIFTYNIRQNVAGDRDSFTWTRSYRFGVGPFSLVLAVSLTGRFEVVDQQLTYRLLEAVLINPANGEREPLDEDNLALIEPAITDGIGALLSQSLRGTGIPDAVLNCTAGQEGADALCFRRVNDFLQGVEAIPVGAAQPHNFVCGERDSGSGSECRFVPNIHRVNHRVDGVEVVLSEEARFLSGADPLISLFEDSPGVCHGFDADTAGPTVCVHDALPELPFGGVPFCGDALLPTPN